MAVTNYYSVNGQIIAEKTSGGSRVDYLTDALGSVTATVDQSAAIVNTYRYKPYGAPLAKTGAGSDPAFRWVGSQGYRQTGKQFSDVYIRRRHYGSELGRWTTKDPKMLEMSLHALAVPNGYLYGFANSTNGTDPTGYGVWSHCRPPDVEAWCYGTLSLGMTCDRLMSKNYAGLTVCDYGFASIRLWSIACGDPPVLFADIIKEHENRHVMDQQECCRRYNACWMQDRGWMTRFHRMECHNKYREWMRYILAYTEFRAYALSADLLNNLMTFEYGCQKNSQDPVCKALKSAYDFHRAKVGECRLQVRCPANQLVACPFDNSGNIDPKWDTKYMRCAGVHPSGVCGGP